MPPFNVTPHTAGLLLASALSLSGCTKRAEHPAADPAKAATASAPAAVPAGQRSPSA